MFTHPDDLRPRHREEARELGVILMDRFERAADMLNQMGADFAEEFFLQAEDRNSGFAPDFQHEMRDLRRRIQHLERFLFMM